LALKLSKVESAEQDRCGLADTGSSPRGVEPQLAMSCQHARGAGVRQCRAPFAFVIEAGWPFVARESRYPLFGSCVSTASASIRWPAFLQSALMLFSRQRPATSPPGPCGKNIAMGISVVAHFLVPEATL
jgi:hypothetical protein